MSDGDFTGLVNEPYRPEPAFTIKDSGARQEFSGGMVRDTTEGKTNFLNVRFGPMFRRWAEHLTKGRQKYPDPAPGVPNWTLAEGVEEYLRAKESAARHFEAWLAGERDEDHAAGVFFNINLAEYALEQLPEIEPGLGAKVTRAFPALDSTPSLPEKQPHPPKGWRIVDYRNPRYGDYYLLDGDAMMSFAQPGEKPYPEENWWILERVSA